MSSGAGSREASEAVRDTSERSELGDLDVLAQLAAGLAHDYNNLLGAILNCRWLLDRRIQDPAARENLEQIRLAAEEGVRLSRTLQQFADQADIEPEPLSAGEFLAQLTPRILPLLGARVALETQLEGASITFLADRSLLAEISTALVENACDAMLAGGVLTIGVASSTHGPNDDAAYADVTFGDTGHGMSSQLLQRAVEPYFTTRSQRAGRGLGLALVEAAVRRQGGTLKLHSVVGAGTTVTISLPIACSGPA